MIRTLLFDVEHSAPLWQRGQIDLLNVAESHVVACASITTVEVEVAVRQQSMCMPTKQE